jgi:hypothetical protein
MPVVIAAIGTRWLPPGVDAQTDEHRLTRDLLVALPAFVADAVNAVDGSNLEPREVIVRVDSLHPLGQNAPDWWITARPSDIEGTEEERELRRFDIANIVRDKVSSLIASKGGPRPSHDVECTPLSGSGISTDNAGEIFQRWGVPAHLADMLN